MRSRSNGIRAQVGCENGSLVETTARLTVQFAIPGIPATAAARVNPQCDIVAKHVEKLLRRLDVRSPLAVEKLRKNVITGVVAVRRHRESSLRKRARYALPFSQLTDYH
jgi:hypothetical protein